MAHFFYLKCFHLILLTHTFRESRPYFWIMIASLSWPLFLSQPRSLLVSAALSAHCSPNVKHTFAALETRHSSIDY